MCVQEEEEAGVAASAGPDDSSPESIISILVATDLHVGYKEKHEARRDDSFLALEEVLREGQERKVDLILLGGDLFHDNTPSRSTVYRTMELFRRYCTGDGAVAIRMLSNPDKTLVTGFGAANFEDENYNIQVPVFTVHGNHDDPSRDDARKSLSAVDILAVANLLNYFGKTDWVDEININPVLIQKGTTKLAMFGLGSIRDARLNRMFQQGKVKFNRPPEDAGPWFNMFVIHQNRNDTGRGKDNCIPESDLPDFLNLVIWGHEHECKIAPVEGQDGKPFFVIQPGSTVATSLVQSEAEPKHMALVEIKGQHFRSTPIRMKCVRPFEYGEVSLAESGIDPNGRNVDEAISKFLTDRVNDILQQVEDREAAMPPGERTPLALSLPLVRLKVEHTNFPQINNQKFGRTFMEKVANPTEILLFHRKARREAVRTIKDSSARIRSGHHDDCAGEPEVEHVVNVESLVLQNLRSLEDPLALFTEVSLVTALEDFVKKNNPRAISEFVDKQLDETRLKLLRSKADNKAAILRFVHDRTEQLRGAEGAEAGDDDLGSDHDHDMGGARAGAGTGSGTGRAGGSRGGAGGGGSGAAAGVVNDERGGKSRGGGGGGSRAPPVREEDPFDDEEVEPVRRGGHSDDDSIGRTFDDGVPLPPKPSVPKAGGKPRAARAPAKGKAPVAKKKVTKKRGRGSSEDEDEDEGGEDDDPEASEFDDGDDDSDAGRAKRKPKAAKPKAAAQPRKTARGATTATAGAAKARAAPAKAAAAPAAPARAAPPPVPATPAATGGGGSGSGAAPSTSSRPGRVLPAMFSKVVNRAPPRHAVPDEDVVNLDD